MTAPSSNDSTLVSWLIGTVVLLVTTLVIGGYWMQSRNQQAQQTQQQMLQYRHYLQDSREAAAAAQAAPHPSVIEARETRAYLLAHPAVTPGDGFNQPGVQSSGKAIVQAMERAQRSPDEEEAPQRLQ